MDAQIIHARIEGVAGPSLFSDPHHLLMDTCTSWKPLSWLGKELLGGPGNMVQRWRQRCFRWRPPVYPKILSGGPLVEAQMARKQWAMLVASWEGKLLRSWHKDCGWVWDDKLFNLFQYWFSNLSWCHLLLNIMMIWHTFCVYWCGIQSGWEVNDIQVNAEISIVGRLHTKTAIYYAAKFTHVC